MARPARKSSLLSRDYSDLPKELLDNIVPKTRGSETRDKIIEVFDKAGKTLSKEEFMIAYYRLFKEVLDRKTATLYLNRVISSNLIGRGEKRGTYNLL